MDAPDAVEQVVAREQLAGALEQVGCQVEFLLRQRDLAPLDTQALARDVDLIRAHGQQRQLAAAQAAAQRGHPGQELGPLGRLDDIVVGTGLQRAQHGVFVVAGGQHQDRDGPAQVGPGPAQQVGAGAVGQHPVDQEQLDVRRRKAGDGLGHRAHRAGGMPGVTQPLLEQRPLILVIFDQAYTQEGAPSRRGPVSRARRRCAPRPCPAGTLAARHGLVTVARRAADRVRGIGRGPRDRPPPHATLPPPAPVNAHRHRPARRARPQPPAAGNPPQRGGRLCTMIG